MIRMQPDQFNLMPHTDMEFTDSETIRVWKTGSLEPDINTYAGVVGSSFHNGTIEADVCGSRKSGGLSEKVKDGKSGTSGKTAARGIYKD